MLSTFIRSASLLFCCSAIAASAQSLSEPERIGTRLELFVDDHLVESLGGEARYELHEPRDEGKVFAYDGPSDSTLVNYVTILHDTDAGVYHMYYRSHVGGQRDYSNHEVTCYAVSADGVEWTRPSLDIYKYDQLETNNVILAGVAPLMHNFSPFIDANPATPADKRFKAVAGVKPVGVHGYASADGVHWEKVQDERLFDDPTQNWRLDSQNVAFWSEYEQKYVLYYRVVPNRKARSVARATSDDFINWSPGEPMTYSDTGTIFPSQQLYTNQTHPYFRAPHIYLATAARFMSGRQVVSDERARELGVNPRYYKDTSDVVLLSTRGGGAHYNRMFGSAFLKPGIGLQNWVSRTNYPALNIVQTGETEMSMYVLQDYAQPTIHLRRYSMRLDGFASVTAPLSGGELLTKPVIFEGDQLLLNFSTSAAGQVRVEIQDAQGQAIPGFALDDCQPVIGNEIERGVQWASDADLSALAGQAVRLRFEIKDAELFAYRFAAD